jgi:hypothetical protein
MEKKLKQVSEGQGFVCATIEEKKRIWQKLTDAGYRMYFEFEQSNMDIFCIKCIYDGFASCNPNDITDPLNESDFFDDWTPQTGEWVEALIYNLWEPHVFVTYWDEKYWIKRNDVYQLHPCSQIRQIKPETMTLQEVREALGKPNLVIE